MKKWLEKLRLLACSRLAWVLVGVLVIHIVGIGWGLPATDGWDDDGVAPRDFLFGVAETFTPGHFYTYPPLHLIVLAILTSPGWIAGLIRAPSFSPHDVVSEFLSVPYMTAFALVGRTVAVAMSLGVVYAFAKVAEELRGRRAGLAVAVVVGLNAPFAYYSHTSNLEVPYCFWASLSLLYLVRAMVHERPAELRWVALCAALAAATKDQAAALFVLGVPATLALWFALDPWPRANARAVCKEAGIALALGLGALLAIDGIVVNPAGFVARVGFLLGSASQDHASYAKSFTGRLNVTVDSIHMFSHFYPAPFGLLALGGLGVAMATGSRAKRVAGAAPILFALSSFGLFNLLARRTDERFLLPQMLILGLYIGLGLEAAALTTPRPFARALGALALPLLAWALYKCAAVDVALLYDTRYDAEAWLAAHVEPGDALEVYGNQVYLPRLPAWARTLRVDQRPVDKRNPLVGAAEVVDRYDNVEQRRPRWIVLAESTIWMYLVDETDYERGGRVMTPGQQAAQRDDATRSYFRDLVAGRRGYALAHVSEWTSTFWPRVQIHGSTGQTIRILERVAREKPGSP
ncbi:MAG TPA: hypothetical protein VGY54_20780 [Polyangiaceae bacterium]|jgi:hypothetical protein|nr:hypothetical protein [Polyangiaceae bacterium]